MSALSQIAKDPSCLLAVDALQGGRWLSCIKPAGVQPSSVPRNFAEEPMEWRDAIAAAAQLSTHDFYFEAEFVADSKPDGTGLIFYNKAVYEPFGVCLRNDGVIIATVTYTNLWEGSGRQYLSLLEGDFGYGELVKVKVVRENGAVEIFCNDVLKTSVTMPGSPSPVQFTSIPSANFSGTIKRITIFDLTTGRTVWSYPSWEERTRLLTKTNVRTDRGVFEAADESKSAGIATPLDFRGNTTSKTFIVRAFCPAHDPDSNRLYLHPLIGQGNIGTGATGFTFHLSVREDRQRGMIQLYPAVSNGSVFYSAYADASELLDSWHVFAFSIEHLPESTVLRSFVDGAQVGSSSAPAFAWGTPTATTAQETTVGIRRDPNASYYAGSLTRISSALIFDRALTQPEIAAISKKL